jgi:hypothetical protein
MSVLWLRVAGLCWGIPADVALKQQQLQALLGVLVRRPCVPSEACAAEALLMLLLSSNSLKNVAGLAASLGAQAFRPWYLLEYVRTPHTPLEAEEQLEQLRIIESGHKLAVSGETSLWL